jgi:hypothetical protein
MARNTDAPIDQAQAVKAVTWLKGNYGQEIADGVKDTHYSIDNICGIACQETAYFWLKLIENGLAARDVCGRCVLDASGDVADTRRSAFPRNTEAFRKVYGDERTQMLIDEANLTRKLRGYQQRDWVYKGYGLFQYDLQFVEVDPDFFFKKQWYDFSACLDRLMRELWRTWALHGDTFDAIRAYNGSGHSAAVYAQNVLAYSGFAGMIPGVMAA